MTDKIVALVTCGSRAEANRIARALVERRLAACVNVMSAPVRSIYRWKGRVETAVEHLLLIKSSKRLLPKLRAAVERLHSYDVPEFIALPISTGSPAYLRWLEQCVTWSQPKPSRPMNPRKSNSKFEVRNLKPAPAPRR